MNKKNVKSKPPYKLFCILFLLILVIVIINNVRKSDTIALSVPNNAGTSVLKTIDNSLVSVFQDGKIVSWNWDSLPGKKSDFKAATDRAIVLDTKHLAVVSKTGKKVLAIYSLSSGKKQKEIPVGWEDQDVWLRISPDKNIIALIRLNNPDSRGGILYEFLTLDIEEELLGSLATLSIQEGIEDFVDYAVDNNSVLYAVGSKAGAGRFAAVDLQKVTVLWDSTFEGTNEFCSIVTSPVSGALYAGNRDGFLYKLGTDTGQIVKKVQLLEDGETRPITNDYSVLNLAFSGDGRCFVATINPKAYILKADSDEIIHVFSPADRLVSKIAFSPDNQFIATSDIRAGYPVKIWKMPKEK